MSIRHHSQNIIVVLGREWSDGRFYGEPAKCLKVKINDTVIISTPDASNLNDSHMLDLMALAYPGPVLFLVRVEKGKQPQGELRKWEEVFGEDISHKMIYITDGCNDDNRFPAKYMHISEDIINQCKHFSDKAIHNTNFCEEVQKRRRNWLEMATKTDTNQSSRRPAPGVQQKCRPLTLVLLGESGSGKSASGNTILGEKVFTSKPSSMPVTTECETWTKSILDREVTVIDTPGFFDDSLRMNCSQIEKCRKLCREGGLCVYLLVIQIGRFTEEESNILEKSVKALDITLRDRAIILFTHGDDLKSNIDTFLRNPNQFLQQLIHKCSGRYQVISNKDSHQREAEKQVEELMRKIADLVQKTVGL